MNGVVFLNILRIFAAPDGEITTSTIVGQQPIPYQVCIEQAFKVEEKLLKELLAGKEIGPNKLRLTAYSVDCEPRD